MMPGTPGFADNTASQAANTSTLLAVKVLLMAVVVSNDRQVVRLRSSVLYMAPTAAAMLFGRSASGSAVTSRAYTHGDTHAPFVRCGNNSSIRHCLHSAAPAISGTGIPCLHKALRRASKGTLIAGQFLTIVPAIVTTTCASSLFPPPLACCFVGLTLPLQCDV